MKTINAYNIQLRFAADQVTSGAALAQAQQAVDLINLELQRQPFGLGAQLIAYSDELEALTVEDDEDDEDESPIIT